ncbi:MAG: type II secretion system secretin GspD [Desulfovermiculus sp.]
MYIISRIRLWTAGALATTAFFCFCLFLSLPQSGLAQEQGPQKVNMDFDQVDLQVFIKFISNLTGKNFVVDDKIKGKVTILSPSPLTVDEAYKVFQSVLEVHGFTTVPAGEVIKIVRTVESRQKETPLLSADPASSEDQVITKIMPLQHASANELRKILVPMVSKQGLIVAYPPTETMILIDYASNVQRISKIVNSVDSQAFGGQITLFSLEHASAKTLSQKLTTLLSAGQDGKEALEKGRISFVPDERTNTIVALGDRNYARKIRDLIQSLDQPTPRNLYNIRVVALENAQAEDMAKVLNQLSGESGTEEEDERAIISKDVSIVADKPSNSLVIVAEPKEFETLLPIIQDLDSTRKQVFVEAAIIEVSSDKSLNFGINWQGGSEVGSDDGIVFGTTNGPLGQGVDDLVDRFGSDEARSGLSLGTLAFPFTFNGEEYFSLGAFINASQTDNAVHIISTPQLMTMENEEATVVIAENRPFITSRQESEANIDYSNFEYKDVGVTLKVTPLINNQGWIKLNLYQEVSRIDPNIDFNSETPITRKRTTETTVSVQDGETVVISGLMENSSSDSQTKVPLLGDIPGLGYLFKSTQDQLDKTNLMVFITPRVVQTAQDAQTIAYSKTRDLNRFRFGAEGHFQALPDEYKTYGLLQ